MFYYVLLLFKLILVYDASGRRRRKMNSYNLRVTKLSVLHGVSLLINLVLRTWKMMLFCGQNYATEFEFFFFINFLF